MRKARPRVVPYARKGRRPACRYLRPDRTECTHTTTHTVLSPDNGAALMNGCEFHCHLWVRHLVGGTGRRWAPRTRRLAKIRGQG